MKIVLERRLAVKKYHIQATISRPVRRDDMVALLKQVEGHTKKRRLVAPEDICSPQGILPNRPLIIAERMIEVAVKLGLAELRDRNIQKLTEDGKQALDDAEIFIPERGTWQIWITQDELLNHPVIDVKVFKEPPAYNDQLMKREGKSRQFQDCPGSIADLSGERVVCHAKEGKYLRFDEVETRVEPAISKDQLTLQLLIDPGATAEAWLVGRLDGENIRSPIHTPIHLEHSEIWKALLSDAGLGDRWSERKGRLLRNFDEIETDLAKDTFLDDQIFPSPNLPGLGTFEDTRIEQISIGPTNDSEAAKWASWLLLHRIGAYQWPEVYQVLTSEIEARFQDHGVTLSSQPDLAQQMSTTIRGYSDIEPELLQRYWRVQAPLDLDGEVTR